MRTPWVCGCISASRPSLSTPPGNRSSLAQGKTLPYDALLIATGGRARRLSIPGSDRPGVLHLRTVEDAAAIDRALASATHVAIIGGGFIGLELASAAITRNVAVTMLEREPEIMMRLMPAPLGRTFRRLAEAHGVEVRRHADIREITQRGNKLGVVTERDTIEVDAVLVGIGLEPVLDLAATAGCAVAGGIEVDAEGRTSVAGIWAAGDCALHHVARDGRRMRLESWHNAEEQGAAAGRSMAGATPATTVKKPWFWTDQFGLNIQMIGSIRAEDTVVREGDIEAAAGAVYRTIDRETGRLTGVIAFSAPDVIRQARHELEAATPFALEDASVVVLADDESDTNTSPSEISAMNIHSPLALTKRYRVAAGRTDAHSRLGLHRRDHLSSARSRRSSTAAPGTMSRSKPRSRTRRLSSAPMSARRRWWSRAPTTARSMCSRIAARIAAPSSAASSAATPTSSSARITSGPTT